MKTVTVTSEAALSVGGAYYRAYTLEDREYKLGEIAKAKITNHSGPGSHSEEVDLEVTEDLLKAIENEREDNAWRERLEKLSANRPTLYAYKLDYLFDNLSQIINEREEFDMHSEIRDAVDRGDYIEKHYLDEDEYEYDEEQYEKDICEYIAKMSIDDLKSFLCYDLCDWTDWEIQELEEKKERMEDWDETDTEEYEYVCKLLEERPDVVILLTEEEKAEYEENAGSSDIVVDGFGYLQMDSI